MNPQQMVPKVRVQRNEEQNWDLGSELGLGDDVMCPKGGQPHPRYSAPRQLPSARIFHSSDEWWEWVDGVCRDI